MDPVMGVGTLKHKSTVLLLDIALVSELVDKPVPAPNASILDQ
jgi:hypothetical protein